jgi:metal-sulfur cluster biosynthetic enzyme
MAITEEAVRETLKQVVDPELFVNVVDLGLVYLVELQEGTGATGDKTDVKIEMTLTSPACPAGPQLVSQAQAVLSRLEGVGNVEVKMVMVPPWTPDRMTEAARDQLGIF